MEYTTYKRKSNKTTNYVYQVYYTLDAQFLELPVQTGLCTVYSTSVPWCTVPYSTGNITTDCCAAWL